MSPTSRNSRKELCLAMSNDGYRLFFTELLREWDFTVLPPPELPAGELTLADELFPADFPPDQVVRLTHSALAGPGKLSLPFPLEALWEILETRFHKVPRKHMRLPLAVGITAHLRGEKAAARLTSLSQVGGRLSLPRELAQGETLAIILPFQEQVFHLPSRVIYANPQTEPGGGFDTGVLFDRIDGETRQQINDEITHLLLSNILPRLPRWAFEVGLSALELSTPLRNRF